MAMHYRKFPAKRPLVVSSKTRPISVSSGGEYFFGLYPSACRISLRKTNGRLSIKALSLSSGTGSSWICRWQVAQTTRIFFSRSFGPGFPGSVRHAIPCSSSNGRGVYSRQSSQVPSTAILICRSFRRDIPLHQISVTAGSLLITGALSPAGFNRFCVRAPMRDRFLSIAPKSHQPDAVTVGPAKEISSQPVRTGSSSLEMS